MKIKKMFIVLAFVASILLMSASVSVAQELVNNLDSYIKSDKSEISFHMSLIEMRNTFPDFDEILEKMITSGEKGKRDVDMDLDIDEEEVQESAEKIGSYYEELKDQGIDLLRATDLIYGSGEELPFDENMRQKRNADKINYMVAMVGRYPAKPLSKFFEKEGYTETGNAVVRNFTKRSERITISLIKDRILLVTPIKENKTIVNRILTGQNLKPGKIEEYVKEAQSKYDLMFFTMSLNNFGPVKGSMLFGNYAGDLSDKDLKFESFNYGMASDGDGGFKMEIDVKGTDEEDMRKLHENLNGIVSLFKLMILNNKEPLKQSLPPEMQNEQVYGKIKDFMKDISFKHNKYNVILGMSFTKELLDIFREMIMSP